MLIKKKNKGCCIQINPYPRQKGDKSESFVVLEDISIATARIKNLYKELSEKEEVTIKHIK